MQRLLVYIRNRYQTSSAGYRYVLFQKMRLTSSSTRPLCSFPYTFDLLSYENSARKPSRLDLTSAVKPRVLMLIDQGVMQVKDFFFATVGDVMKAQKPRRRGGGGS